MVSFFCKSLIANNVSNMPDELLKKINQPFFTTKPVGIRTGLGLSISTEIVADHNGVFNVRSDPGEFTELVILMPAEEYNRGDTDF